MMNSFFKYITCRLRKNWFLTILFSPFLVSLLLVALSGVAGGDKLPQGSGLILSFTLLTWTSFLGLIALIIFPLWVGIRRQGSTYKRYKFYSDKGILFKALYFLVAFCSWVVLFLVLISVFVWTVDCFPAMFSLFGIVRNGSIHWGLSSCESVLEDLIKVGRQNPAMFGPY